jgi:uncharacterized protein YndB with AHSA1/START domain
VAQWWGPNGFTNPVCELDVRVGGAIRIHMRAPNGVVYPMKGVFEEIDEPNRLVFISSALDEHGNSMFDVMTTVTFAEQNAKTTLTMQARVMKATALAPQYLKGMEAGWTQSLDRLGTHLGSMSSKEGDGLHLAKKSSMCTADREIVATHMSADNSDEQDLVLTRVLDAPRELVFKAWTEPERLAQWWGPKGGAIQVQKMDLRPGGIFHYVMRHSQGDMWGKFVYREIAAPERIVFVNSFSNEKGETARSPFHPNWPLDVLNKLTLSEHEGKTKLTLRGRPINATEEEQKIFESFRESMQQGFAGTFEQLDEYLAKA